MQRNTFLFASLLAVVAALLFGFNIGRRFSSKPGTSVQPTPSLTPTPGQLSLTEYSNSYCGISFSYPSGLTKLEATSGAVFINPNQAQDSLAVTCQDEVPRPPLPAEKIEALTIASVAATLYHDATGADGTPIDKLIFAHPTKGLDIFIAGFGDVFNTVIASLRLF